MPRSSHDGRPDGRAVPAALRVVLVAVAAEVALLGAAGAFALVELVRGNGSVGINLFLALFAWGVGAVLAAAARGLGRGHRWARSPTITWQLFQVVIGITWLQAAVNPFAVGLLVLALGIVVGLLVPDVVAATTKDARPAGPDGP